MPTDEQDHSALLMPEIDSLRTFLDLLQEFTGDASTPDEAIDNLWDAIDENVNAIYDRSEPYGAFDVVAVVRFSETAGGPEFRQKLGHEGFASAVEIAANILSCRPSRYLSVVSNTKKISQNDAAAVQEIIDKSREALRLMSLVVIAESFNSESAGSHFEAVTRLRDLNVRNLSYPHVVTESLLALFETDRIANICQDILGYTASEFFKCFDSIQKLLADGVNSNLDYKRKLMSQLEQTLDQLDSPSTVFGLSDESRGRIEEIWDQMWSYPSRGTTFTTTKVADDSGLDIATITTILDDYSTCFREQDPTAAIKAAYLGTSKIRRRPLLMDDEGNYTLVHTALHTEIFREVSEEKLKSSIHWDTYQKERGLFLERNAIMYLQDILAPDAIFQSIEYMFPRSDSETGPGSYMGSAECDALILVADAAIIVEAKAGSLHAPDERRSWKTLRRDLTRIVKHASSQASRIARLIEKDKGLQTRCDGWLDLSFCKSIYPITVSLDNLTGIVTTTSELLDHGILDEEWIPWTISLYDLHIIRDLVQSRTEFLLYLATRLDSRCVSEVRALDELDLFLHFYSHRLVGIDTDDLSTTLSPDTASSSSLASHANEATRVNFLANATAELDAWYLSYGPKPKLNADPRALELAAQLDERGLDGWLTAGMILLSLGRRSQEDLLDNVTDAIQMSELNGQSHSVTVGGLFLGVTPFVLAFLTPDFREDAASMETHIQRYLRAKKYQLQADIGVGILLLPGLPTRFIYTYFVDDPWTENAEMRELVQNLNLRSDSPLTE